MSPPPVLRAPRLIPFHSWPAHLRDRVIESFGDPTIEDADGNLLAELSEDTQTNYKAALSVFLMFLLRSGISLAQGWEALLQPQLMWAFYVDQKAHFDASNRCQTGKPRTAQDYFDRIVSARLRLVPGQREILFDELRRRERRRSKCKQTKLVAPIDSQTLYRIATKQLEHYKAIIETGRATKLIFSRYQTALQVGFLSQVPVRKSTLLLMRIRDLQEANGRFVFHLDVPKNRGKETVTRENSEELTPYWLFFLESVRPFFRPDDTGALWSERTGKPLGAVNFTERFRRFIKREADVHMRPHLVRHAGASLAEALELDPRTVAAVIQDLSSSTPALHYASHKHSFSAASLDRLSRFSKGAV